MEEGIRFVDGGAFSDDLTVLVARLNNEARESRRGGAISASSWSPPA
jgi:hypothetical protein